MKMISRSWMAAAGLAACLSTGVPLAQGSEYAVYHGMQIGGEHEGGRMLAYLADELDLSETQEAEIRALHEEVAEQNAADRERLEELKERMRAQVDDFDAGEAQRIADEIGEIATRLAYSGASTRAGVRALLTDEQRVLLDELMAERRERHERWRDRASKRSKRDQF